ncbi:MAG TPA: cytochrome C oxidase subunit IV family protein [Candidatus Saccharibacteria bacterium]|nr:cytochrome C oxidase subunit IV family protein [Candidatus Saccharibacteria bacterium]HRK94661.1 cytochrome C oxidase subunit IV family protein [Candidatus Saccharibacteria bacterium]
MKSERSFKSWVSLYVFGFGTSLVLSVASYLCVTQGWFGDASALAALMLLVLATAQLAVQSVCFLHLGTNPRSVFKTHTFIFTLSMLLIIVVGSLWIMQNLDYRMGMSPDEMNDYMYEQNKKGF